MKIKKRLFTHYRPDLRDEWHPTKNIGLDPNTITRGSHKRCWWLCKEGHEWQAVIKDRVSKVSRCPICYGKKVSRANNLQAKYPEVAKEWNHQRNFPLLPIHVMPSAKKKVWWVCWCRYEWQATCSNRTNRKSGCPMCYIKKIAK